MPITQTEPRTTPSILRASMIVHLRASRLFAMAPISAGARGQLHLDHFEGQRCGRRGPLARQQAAAKAVAANALASVATCDGCAPHCGRVQERCWATAQADVQPPIHKIGADLEICVDLPLGFGYMSSVNQPMTLTTTRPLMRPLTKSSNADGSASSPMVRVTSLRWRGLRSDANRSQTR